MRVLSASILGFALSCSAFLLRADDAPSRAVADRDASSLVGLLLEKPDVETLRKLLVNSGAKQSEPIKLTTLETGVANQVAGPVWKFDLKEGLIIGVLAEVGPPPDPLLYPTGPRALFLFNAEGKLILEAGGGLGSTGSPEQVDVVNLGPAEDWFVRVMCSEKRKPLDVRREYYRVAEKPVRSLRVFVRPNGSPWTWGPKEKIRHGFLSFDNDGTGNRLPFRTLGKTDDQGFMPRTLYWDADRNRFFGAVAASCDGIPIFEVDTEWSRDFESLARKPDQMLIFGGVHDYDSWHYWEVLVPEETEARVTLRLPDLGDHIPAKSETAALKAGLHVVQLQVKPGDDGLSLQFELRIDEEKPQKFKLPAHLSARQPDPPAVVRVIDRGSKPRLLEVGIDQAETPVSLTIWRP